MDSQPVRCPYCGEWLEVLIDPSVRLQEYVEDCQVCCRPMTLTVTLGVVVGPDDVKAQVEARTEDA